VRSADYVPDGAFDAMFGNLLMTGPKDPMWTYLLIGAIEGEAKNDELRPFVNQFPPFPWLSAKAIARPDLSVPFAWLAVNLR
jgi:hypothetical protein